MSLLTTILTFLTSEALSAWAAVTGSFNTLLQRLETDEITILHGAQTQFLNDLANGKGYGEAVADALTFAANQEGKALGTFAMKLLEAFFEGFKPPTA